MVTLKVFVLQDTDLMKFVFDDDPVKVSKQIADIKSELESAFALPLSINIYDTEFYSQYDGSLDFGRTSSCFQVIVRRKYREFMDLCEAMVILLYTNCSFYCS